jgi:hypothetical protein
MINFEQIKILRKPKGRVIFVACDSLYFERFSRKLSESFLSHIKSFNGLHIHVIAPSKDVLSKITQFKYSNISYSYEDSIKIGNISGKCSGRLSWFSSLPNQVKSMLLTEQVRDNKIGMLVVSLLTKLQFPKHLLISSKWMQANKSKVYYACRRFMMPVSFFDDIEAVLIVDIDSYFNADVIFDFDASISSAFAICRRNSWSKFLAGFVYVENNTDGVLFLNKMRNDLIEHFSGEQIYWGLDQVLLDRCGELGLLSCFSSSDVSFESKSRASFISMKGNAKWLN